MHFTAQILIKVYFPIADSFLAVKSRELSNLTVIKRGFFGADSELK